MKKIFNIVFSFIAILSISACSSNSVESNNQTSEDTEKIIITHSLGEVEVSKKPKRIAVLDMAVLDIIDSIGLGDYVVGIPKQSQVSYLKSYIDNESIAHLGSLKEIDMEKLNSLEPDIIFIGGRLRSEYDNLNKIAPTVFLNINHENGYLNSFEENLKTVSSIFETENKTNNIIDDFKNRLESIKEVSNGKNAIGGVVTSGSFNTLGNTGRCSMLFNEAGFENLANDVESTHGDSASFELLLDKNPDFIFVLDRDFAINAEGASTAQEIMENEIVIKTNAYKDNQIVYLTPDVWYLAEGGITATDIMISDLEKNVLKK